MSKTKLAVIFDHIIRHLNGDYGHRFYYLPPCSTGEVQFNRSYLDFQKIFTLSQEKCEPLKTTRIRTVCDPFRAQIFTRCVSYLGRIGTPDFAREDVYSLLQNCNLRFRTEDLDDLWQRGSVSSYRKQIKRIYASRRTPPYQILIEVYTFTQNLPNNAFRKESSRSSVWVFLSTERPGGNSSIVTFSKKAFE